MFLGCFSLRFDLYLLLVFCNIFLRLLLNNWTFHHSFFRRLFNRGLCFGNNLPYAIERFGDDIFFSKTKIDRSICSSFFGIIIISSISTVKIIIPFKPLNKLKVILVFGFGQFLYINVSFNACFVESGLKDFEIIYELILSFCFPIYLIQGDLTRVNDVDDLTIDRARSKLLNFANVQLL